MRELWLLITDIVRRRRYALSLASLTSPVDERARERDANGSHGAAREV